MKRKVYQAIASAFVARLNCDKYLWKGGSDSEIENWETWYANHTYKIEDICKNHMPSGSGFDCGTKFDFEASKPDKLVFISDYHYMDENGYYDGWSENIKIVVTPSFDGINLRITGIRRKNSCDSEFFYDTFYHALTAEIDN